MSGAGGVAPSQRHLLQGGEELPEGECQHVEVLGEQVPGGFRFQTVRPRNTYFPLIASSWSHELVTCMHVKAWSPDARKHPDSPKVGGTQIADHPPALVNHRDPGDLLRGHGGERLDGRQVCWHGLRGLTSVDETKFRH